MSGLEDSMDGLSLLALENLATGKQKKEVADAAFKAGNIADALRSYHEALLYLRGLNKNNPTQKEGENTDGKPKNEIEELQAKIYSNMSACHTKRANWHRTIETADKALALDKENVKAKFRKAKAQGEIGYFEKAEVLMNELLAKNPPDASSIKAELESLRAKDNERQRKHNQKLRGFLSRDKTILEADPPPSSHKASEAAPSAKIEEIVEDETKD